MNQDLRNAVNRVIPNTYMDLDIEEEKLATFSTRENGDVYSCVPGQADLNHAYALRLLVEQYHPEVMVEVQYTDEWVTLMIQVA